MIKNVQTTMLALLLVYSIVRALVALGALLIATWVRRHDEMRSVAVRNLCSESLQIIGVGALFWAAKTGLLQAVLDTMTATPPAPVFPMPL